MISVRTCIGCRSREDKSSLVRCVSQNGTVVIDAPALELGRGAWIHPTLTCFDRAVTRKAFGRGLRTTVTDTSAAREHLEKMLGQRASTPKSGKG